MRAIITVRSSLLGFASWLVPFGVSFAFFDRTGQLMVQLPLFKSIMVVVGGGVGVVLLAAAFSRIPPSTVRGAALGVYWLVLNLALDLAVLVPFTKMPVGLYFYDIGLRYLLLPIVAVGMGWVAARSLRP